MGRFLKTTEIDSFDDLYRAALHAVDAGAQTVALNPVELCVLLSRFSKATDTSVRAVSMRPFGTEPPIQPAGTPAPRSVDEGRWAPLRDLLAQSTL